MQEDTNYINIVYEDGTEKLLSSNTIKIVRPDKS